MTSAGCSNAMIALVLFTISLATYAPAATTLERVCIRGNTRTRDKVIRREIRIAESQPFEVADLEDVTRRLDALGYFDRVDVTTRPGSSRGLVVLDIAVKEKAWKRSPAFSSVENFIAEVRMCQNCRP